MKLSPYLNRSEDILRTEDDLPHWHQSHRLQFLTWCLGDALPIKAMLRLRRERIRWINAHPPPHTPEENVWYFDRFIARPHRWLALGRGESIFRNPEYADLLASVLLFHEGTKCRMDAFVIMPNHVHCLVQLIGDTTLSQLLHSWRSYSAQQINRRRGHRGNLWSGDFWDRCIRSPAHYWKVRTYIQENPVKARLPESHYHLWTRPVPLLEDLRKKGYDC